MLVSLRAQRVGALSTSSTQPPPCAPVRPPNWGDTFPRHEVLTVAWPLQAALLFHAALLPDEAVYRNPWRAESSASVVRRASCTLALFRHSHPVPFLIRAKNIFSESDFSWAYCFHSHFHQSTAVTDNFQQVSIQRVSPPVSLDKLFLVIIICYRQTTSANSSGWLTMIAPDWHCQTYKNNTAKWSRINYTMLK